VNKDHQIYRSGNGLPACEPTVLRPSDSEGNSTVSYDGDAARVTEGFAIALGLLGLSAGMVEDVPRGRSEDGE